MQGEKGVLSKKCSEAGGACPFVDKPAGREVSRFVMEEIGRVAERCIFLDRKTPVPVRKGGDRCFLEKRWRTYNLLLQFEGRNAII